MEVRKDLLPSAFLPKRRNFTLIEKRCLFSLAAKFKHILENKICNARMNNKKNEVWDRITEIYNSLPEITDMSSKKQLQHLYKNTKKIARREKVDINTLFENRGQLLESMDSSVTLDGYDPIDKSLLEIVPLPSSSNSDSIIRTIKCEVLEDDQTDNSPCIVSSNSTDSAVISTPSDENVLLKKVFDIIENSSNSTDCDVTSTPPEDNIDKQVEEIVKKCLNTTSCPAKPLEEQTISINDDEVQSNNEQASNSHPTSTTAPLGEQLLTSYRKKKREPASMRAADAIHNQTVTRIKHLEEEHELIKKKLRLEIDSQIESEKRADAQHKYMMERMKREDEQSEKLYAAKLRALEAKARYFENKMNVK